MTIELRPLRHLVTLVELGSFARAAATLRLSQPALTRSIQALERRVGTELVLRSPAGVIPTDVGQLLSQRARELLQLAEDLERDVISKSTLQSGHVAVGAGPYPAETIFVVALQNFAAAYPMVKVRLQIRAWDELLSRLRSREIDFFVAEVSTLQREVDLDIEALDEHPLYFVARPGHPLAGRAEITAKETLAFPFVTMSRISPRILQPMIAAQRSAARRSTQTPPFPAIESATLSVLRRMVIASDMIAAVTLPCIREDLESGRIVILGSEPWLKLAYGIVALKARPISAASIRLRDMVRQAERLLVAEELRLIEGAGLAAARRSTASRPPTHR
jgi:DNA-binding transcriptional LysR family regulator